MIVKDKELIDIAKEYASNGWAVLPLHSVINEQCSCPKRRQCEHPGKHPLNHNGVTGATIDLEQIDQWWTKWPWANIGIATGIRSGIAVIDIDPRHGGFESLDKLTIAQTRTVQTGGKGLHFYCKINEPTPTNPRVAPGIELRADGAYVVAPPSQHIQGEYRWLIDQELIPLPPDLSAKSSNGKSDNGNIIEPDQKRWVAELMSSSCPEGQRNEALTRLAGYFRNVLPEQVALTILHNWNQTWCEPPLSTREVEQNVRHKYRRYAGLDLPEAQIWTARTLLAADLPEPVFVIQDYLPEGLAFLAGRPKRGKSWLAMQISIDATSSAISLGKAVRNGRVIYIALEDSPRRLKSRLKLMQAKPSDDLIFLTQFPHLDEGGLAEMGDLLNAHRPVLVVLDTLSRTLGRQYNQDKNADMTAILDPLQKLAMAHSCTILLVDHHRKQGIELADAIDDIMGSTAKVGVADAIWGLYRKTGESTATLKMTGRDLEEQELAVVWDGLHFQWRVEGTATERALMSRIYSVIEYMKKAGEVDNQNVAKYLNMSEDTAAAVLKEIRARRLATETSVPTNQRGRPRLVYALTTAGLTYSEYSEK